ncbi:MAG: hypothetical protein ACLUR5_00480 [Eubacterium ventriosum]
MKKKLPWRRITMLAEDRSTYLNQRKLKNFWIQYVIGQDEAKRFFR